MKPVLQTQRVHLARDFGGWCEADLCYSQLPWKGPWTQGEREGSTDMVCIDADTRQLAGTNSCRTGYNKSELGRYFLQDSC